MSDVEDRNGIQVLVMSQGCRPANDVELEFWNELTKLRATNEAIAARVEQMREALEALLAEREWMPIETAPKDKRVLVWSGQEIYAAHWAKNITTDDEAWIVAEWGTEGDQALVKPTHWMPLPKTPDAGVTGSGENI